MGDCGSGAREEAGSAAVGTAPRRGHIGVETRPHLLMSMRSCAATYIAYTTMHEQHYYAHAVMESIHLLSVRAVETMRAGGENVHHSPGTRKLCEFKAVSTVIVSMHTGTWTSHITVHPGRSQHSFKAVGSAGTAVRLAVSPEPRLRVPLSGRD